MVGDGEVQSHGVVRGRVVDDGDPVVLRGEPVRELGRAVIRGSERDDQFDRPVDLLRQRRRDGVLEVVDLVEHRHDERHSGSRRHRGGVAAVRLRTRRTRIVTHSSIIPWEFGGGLDTGAEQHSG